MIKINNIGFAYDEKTVFENFSLNISGNSRLCLFGDSGMGKTTLLRLIMGLELPQSGAIVYSKQLRFSVVFQEDRLLPFMSINDNCRLVGASRETVAGHLKTLGIASVGECRPKELSGGMRRRAAIARALSAEYDVLILDEPFSGLDEENIKTAAAHISEQLYGKILIMVTHSAVEAELMGAQIIGL